MCAAMSLYAKFSPPLPFGRHSRPKLCATLALPYLWFGNDMVISFSNYFAAGIAHSSPAPCRRTRGASNMLSLLGKSFPSPRHFNPVSGNSLILTTFEDYTNGKGYTA